METQKIRKLLEEHLKNCLIPWSEEDENLLKDYLKNPLRNPQEGGGLTKQGIEFAKEIDPSLIEKSKSHQENTRVKIQSVLLLCELFAKTKRDPFSKETQENLEKLKRGIKIRSGDKEDWILTTKLGGKYLTEPFKEMMARLHTALKKQGNPLYTIIEQAAYAQLAEEKKSGKSRTQKLKGKTELTTSQ